MFNDSAFDVATKAAATVVRNPKYRRWITLATTVAIVAVAVSWFYPLIEAPTRSEILAANESARTALKQARDASLDRVAVPLSPLVMAYISTQSPSYSFSSGDIRLRWDNFVILIGGLLILTFITREVVLSSQSVAPAVMAQQIGANEAPTDDVCGVSASNTEMTEPDVASSSPRPTATDQTVDPPSSRPKLVKPALETIETSVPKPSIDTVTSPADTLEADVNRAVNLAAALYSRSTLLLAGGVIMSFVGIGVFWASLPNVPAVGAKPVMDVLAAYLPSTIRPLGMLIFVEAIAWFLLRQYRTLIEDYKQFHRMYLRRANFLVALKIARQPHVTPAELSIAAALLVDDVAGRLKKDETTEHLESVKQIEPNPVITLFATLIDRTADVASGFTRPPEKKP